MISWTGVPLSSKDEIEILLSDSTQTHYFSPKIVGATSLTLGSNDLLPIKVGNGELSIVRKVTLSLQNGKPIGGVIGSEYKSKRISVKIVQ